MISSLPKQGWQSPPAGGRKVPRKIALFLWVTRPPNLPTMPVAMNSLSSEKAILQGSPAFIQEVGFRQSCPIRKLQNASVPSSPR